MSKTTVKTGVKVRIVNAVPEAAADYGYENGEDYEVKCVLSDGEPCIWPDGDAEREVYLEHWEYEIIDGEAEASTKSTAEQLAEARAKVVELETKMRGEIAEGSLAIVVIHEDDDEEVPIGTLVRISRVDVSDESLPFCVTPVGGSGSFWLPLGAVEPVTYESARARLIAEVDRQLAEAFPGAAA